MNEDTKLNTNLSNEEKQSLTDELNNFARWLKDKRVISESTDVSPVMEWPYADEDFIMNVNIERREVSFNTLIRDRCSPEYYKIVVLHEFFHLVVQKVPNKDDATKIKDDFGAELMKLIDIEADFYVALYLKETLGYTLPKYWAINKEGGSVFTDRWVRAIKFERFIGTLLSISKIFLHDECLFDLYLPTISPIYTEDSLHILVIKKEHIYFDEIKATYQDFAKLKECYQDATKFSERGYVKELIEFSCKALELNMPEHMATEIEKLKH